MVQETLISSKYSEPKIQNFNYFKWIMKNIKMKLSSRQVTFRFCLLVCLSRSTVSYVNYNIEESEVALDFCQKVPSNYCILQCERKNPEYICMFHTLITIFYFCLVTRLLCSWNIYYYRVSYSNCRLHGSWWQFTSFLYFLLSVYHLKNK